ncbi:PREDICTED: claspin-like [Dufourea novaeangliae]|uniref:claspin-like n=1 Tax=Dufourea novaeangliae TaxID=178035 RepID=UPI0007674077|nr:PREDICTED: claspin-like [Dufourea novaeangliae]
MSRSVKDSDEEVDTKAGRKTRGLAGSGTVDSPLRRSSRVKTVVKQNESSPEASLSDTGNINTTQTTRNTRRRITTLDSFIMTEKSRTLRPRRNSTASDITETTDKDSTVATPTKKTNNISVNDGLNETNGKTSKRLSRAGSEIKSPSTVTRSTRRTRASSMEPEAVGGNKLTKMGQSELIGSSVRSRNRASMLPTEATVIEETEVAKIPVVTLDRVLPNLKEINETYSENSTSEKTDESLCISKDVLHISHENVCKQGTDVHMNDMTPSEGSMQNTSKEMAQTANENTSKELGLKMQNILNNSITGIDRDLTNKENQTENITGDSQSNRDTVSNVLLQSPTSPTASNLHTGKSGKESDDDADSSDNMQKLVVTDTESLNEIPLTDGVGQNVTYVEVCEDSSLDDSIEILNCPEIENDAAANKSFDLNNKSKQPIQQTVLDSETCNKDKIVEMISNSKAKEATNTSVESAEVSINQILIPDNESELKEKIEESNISRNIKDPDDIHHVEILSRSDLNSATLSLEKNTMSSITARDETATHDSQDIDQTNNVSTQENIVPDPLGAHMSSENYLSTNKTEDIITNVVKSSQSHTVTESSAKPSDEISEKEDATHTSMLNNSVTSKRESISKSESSNKQIKQNVNHETSKEHEEKMKVDDGDSDAIVDTDLFHDISADEWKERNFDKNSVYSMSTEKLQNESENECDLVLIDGDARQVAENMEKKKENAIFDYDSDDTVLLKAQRDSLKRKEEEKLDIPQDDNKHTPAKVKSNRKSKQQEEIQKKANAVNDSIDAVQDPEHINKCTEETETGESIYRKKSVTEDTSFNKLRGNESWTAMTQENLDKSTIDSPLKETELYKYMATKRKSNKSFKDLDSEIEECNESEAVRGSKSLNKSSVDSSLNKGKSSEDMSKKRKSFSTPVEEVDSENEGSDESEAMKGRKSLSKSSVDSSLNKSKLSEDMSKKRKSFSTPAEEVDSESDGFDESEAMERRKSLSKSCIDSSLKKSKLSEDMSKKRKSFSTAVEEVDSESEGSDESETMKGRKFWKKSPTESSLNSSGSDKSDKSIDSDIEREYNLHGKEVSKFSDDDVPGDECRASETESSDPDDHGSDLQDFVVDDDDVSEENEEEDQSNNEVDNENDVKDQETNEESIDDQLEKVQMKEKTDGIATEENKVQNEIVKENVETVLNKSSNICNKEENKLRHSGNLDLSQISEDGKKVGKISQIYLSEIDEDEEKCDLLNEFFSRSPQMKNSRPKMQKLSRSMECSTPKLNSLKRDQFHVSLESTIQKVSDNTCEFEGDIYSSTERDKATILKLKTSLKKSNNTKDTESLLHGFPALINEHAQKTNLSRPMSSKVIELNRTTSVPWSESPTVRHLRKEKLNESLPVLKLDSNLRKSISNSKSNEQCDTLSHSKVEHVNVEEYYVEEETTNVELNVKPAQEMNESLKNKLLKVAENILETDCQKKEKKRKKRKVNKTVPTFDEDGLEENVDSQISRGDQDHVPNTNSHESKKSTEICSNEKKKKKPNTEADIENLLQNKLRVNVIEAKPKCNEEKKKRKQKKDTVSTTNIDNIAENEVFTKKKSKNKVPVLSEEDLVKNLTKSKRKFKNIVSQDEEIMGNVSRKKQKLSENIVQIVNTSKDKSSKKEQKLLPKNTVSQDESILVEQVSKKKQKKRKERKVKKTVPTSDEDGLEGNVDSQISGEDQEHVRNTNSPESKKSTEICSNEKKKKKSNTEADIENPLQNELRVNVIEARPKFNEEQKKGKQNKNLVGMANIHSITENEVLAKKKSKNIVSVLPEEDLVKNLTKSKRKFKNIVSQDEEIGENVSQKKQKLSENIVSQTADISKEKLSKKKRKLLPKNTVLQDECVSVEQVSKKKKKSLPEYISKTHGKFVNTSNKTKHTINTVLDSVGEPAPVIFSKTGTATLNIAERVTGNTTSNKDRKRKKVEENDEKIENEIKVKTPKQKSIHQTSKSKQIEVSRKSIKYLPEELVEHLVDSSLEILKKRKVSKPEEQVLPSCSMFDSNFSVSSYGSTTNFSVTNLQKAKKTKTAKEVQLFRQKMLIRNSRQRVSAYLMYVEKQKVSGKGKI